MTQLNFLETTAPAPAARTPSPVALEKARLSKQCEMILATLRRGRTTNASLSLLALKYTSRLSDCRAAGYDIRVVERDYKTGLTTYALFEKGIEVTGGE